MAHTVSAETVSRIAAAVSEMEREGLRVTSRTVAQRLGISTGTAWLGLRRLGIKNPVGRPRIKDSARVRIAEVVARMIAAQQPPEVEAVAAEAGTSKTTTRETMRALGIRCPSR